MNIQGSRFFSHLYLFELLISNTQILPIQKNLNLLSLTFPHRYISTLRNIKFQNEKENALCSMMHEPRELGECDEHFSTGQW